MSETCAPRRLERAYGCFSLGEAMSVAAWALNRHLTRPHIWKRNGMWMVGWRYVGPAIPPDDQR